MFAVLLSGCSGDVAAETAEPAAAQPADIATCLTINPTGRVTTAPAEPCLAHGAALTGFHEGAELVEFAGYQPGNAGPVATEIRRVAAELEGASLEASPADQRVLAERSASLEVIAVLYDETEAAWALRAPGVESSLGGDAAYIEVVTRTAWEGYFATFFDSPSAAADSAHVVERIFVRMRGFELS